MKAAPVTPARVGALNTLRAVRRGELADRALFAAFDQVSPRDRPWLQELVYGTLRLRGRIDHLLKQLVRGGLDRLEPDVLDVLRLGAYQLFEMGSVPVYAAVSQAVELAKAASGPGAGRLVNGVLQSLARSQDQLTFPTFESEPVAHLSTWGSHPRWLVERWVARFGAEEARALVEANNRRPELYLLPLHHSPDAAIELLRIAGIDARPVPGVPGSLRLQDAAPNEPPPSPPPDVLRSPLAAPAPQVAPSTALAALPSIIQDPAATLVVYYAAPEEGVRIADVAAAPGGKALALASGSGGGSSRFVVAGDVSYARVRRLRENAERVGQVPLGIMVGDARRPALRERTFDLVLLDAPCTGTGTLRRHPDGRWRITPRDLALLAPLQHELLRGAATLVRPGGVLVYATCSLEPEENEQQVEQFLVDHSDFALVRSPAELEACFLDAEGRLTVLPQRDGFDGAFAVRLRQS